MNFQIGIKTDPIETRYSFPWLFDLLAEEGIRHVQIGSFFELYHLEAGWFDQLKREAAQRNLILKSLFTSHRELGGFFYGDPYMERAARQGCERLLEVASLLGVDYCGWNPGSIYRDRLKGKTEGLVCFHRNLHELMHHAHGLGLKAITVEPMSCLAEPPSTPDEIRTMMETADAYHCKNPGSTVPVYLCGDISHGVADENGDRHPWKHGALRVRQVRGWRNFISKTPMPFSIAPSGSPRRSRRVGLLI